MQIVVCIKSVPDTTQVRFDPDTNTLVRSEAESIINPFDLYAIEEGLRLVEQYGGKVTAISMGPPQAENELREALAMGCDEAVLLSAPEFAGSDTWATAYSLAGAISHLDGYDLVICGRQAIDGDTGQVGPGLARQLGIPQLTYVSRIQELVPDAGRILVERLLEEGRELVEATLPAVLTVVKDINSPRAPTPRGLRRARKQEIPIWGPEDIPGLCVDEIGLKGSPTRVVSVSTPPRRPRVVQIVEGEDPAEIAAALVERLIAEKLV